MDLVLLLTHGCDPLGHPDLGMTLAAHLTHVLQEGWPINSQQTTQPVKRWLQGGATMQKGELQHEGLIHGSSNSRLLSSFYRSIEIEVVSNCPYTLDVSISIACK